MNESENIVDDKGTTQDEAQELLANLCRDGSGRHLKMIWTKPRSRSADRAKSWKIF